MVLKAFSGVDKESIPYIHCPVPHRWVFSISLDYGCIIIPLPDCQAATTSLLFWDHVYKPVGWNVYVINSYTLQSEYNLAYLLLYRDHQFKIPPSKIQSTHLSLLINPCSSFSSLFFIPLILFFIINLCNFFIHKMWFFKFVCLVKFVCFCLLKSGLFQKVRWGRWRGATEGG